MRRKGYGTIQVSAVALASETHLINELRTGDTLVLAEFGEWLETDDDDADGGKRFWQLSWEEKLQRAQQFGAAAVRQRCQSHLRRNAQTHASTAASRNRLAGELGAMWDADDLPAAEAALAALVDSYRRSRRGRVARGGRARRADGLQPAASHRRQLLTTNPIKRLNQEVRRRTRLVRVVVNEASAKRLASGMLIEIDEE